MRATEQFSPRTVRIVRTGMRSTNLELAYAAVRENKNCTAAELYERSPQVKERMTLRDFRKRLHALSEPELRLIIKAMQRPCEVTGYLSATWYAP